LIWNSGRKKSINRYFMCEIRFLNGFQRSNSILFFVVLQFYLLIMWKKNSMVSKHHLNFHVPNLLWIVKLEWQEFARNNLKVSHFCCSVQELCDFKFLYHVYICLFPFIYRLKLYTLSIDGENEAALYRQ
jgi:hypothetical protein